MAGCKPQDSIRQYQIPHESVEISKPSLPSMGVQPSSGVGQRMLAAIVPQDRQAWFFKLMGPADDVGAGQTPAEFRQVVDSVKFDADGIPTWELPTGWDQQAGNEFRFATLKKDKLELTVSALPLTETISLESYVLSNVNRWRQQLSLGEITAGAMASEVETVQQGEQTVWFVDLRSKKDAAATETSVSPNVAVNSEAAPASPPAPQSPASPSKELPDGWTPIAPKPFSLATYEVNRNGKRIEITLSALGTQAGTLLANVNRWRNQIGLPQQTAEELAASQQTLEVGGTARPYIILQNPDASPDRLGLMAVVIQLSDRTLFAKLSGDLELALAEQTNFESFVTGLEL